MSSTKGSTRKITTPVSHSRLSRLPIWLSHWLGHRQRTPESDLPSYLIWFWSFVGAFCGLAVIQAVFGQAHYFIRRGVPQIVPSYGASAVLIFGAIEAPLAHPRALMGGHFLGALIGVCINKLFLLLPTEERYEQLTWLAVSLSCAVTIVVMQMTATSHPPAGATAILPALDSGVRDMGWYYLPVILLTSTLSLAVALIVDNIQRRYPLYWFKPAVTYPAPPPSKEAEMTMTARASATRIDDGSEVTLPARHGDNSVVYPRAQVLNNTNV